MLITSLFDSPCLREAMILPSGQGLGPIIPPSLDMVEWQSAE